MHIELWLENLQNPSKAPILVMSKNEKSNCGIATLSLNSFTIAEFETVINLFGLFSAASYGDNKFN